MTAQTQRLRAQIARKMRAVQADPDPAGGVLMTDEPDEPVPCTGYDLDRDGDDDSCPEGDTDNSHWNVDGEQVAALPGRPLVDDQTAGSLRSARADCGCPEHRWGGRAELRWDGPAAMSTCANSDTPASCYQAICAGKRKGDPGLESTWALPHHAHPGASPDPVAVRAALAALNGARGGVKGLVNRDAARAHLERHLSELGGDA